MKHIAEVYAEFKSEILPGVIEAYGIDDDIAISEAWNDYTDSECKSGELSDLQCQHCPAWGERMPTADSELEWLLGEMGVTFDCRWTHERPNAVADGWSADANHYAYTIKRGHKTVTGHYTKGPALPFGATLIDVVQSLLSDISTVDRGFEDWCVDMGFDTDSRRAERIYGACLAIRRDMTAMFEGSELDDLTTLFGEWE